MSRELRTMLALTGALGAVNGAERSARGDGEPSDVRPAQITTPNLANVRAEPRWYDRLDVGAFVDTYYAQNWRSPRPNEASNALRAFDANAGFGVPWLGLDVAMPPSPVGAVMQVRLGPGASVLAMKDATLPGGLGFVQNAHVLYRPGGADGKLTLVLGKWDTVFGAEVPQSQLNLNYTRGLLYTLAQPFFHTGLRADWQATDNLALKLLVVNGWNATLDTNRGKSFGAQASWSAGDTATFSVGYLGGAEEDDVRLSPEGKTVVAGAETRLRHMADAVVDLTPTRALRFVVNGTYVTQAVAGDGADAHARWYGAAAFGRVRLDASWALAGRAEWLSDPDAQTTTTGDAFDVYSGTLTLEDALTKHLLVRLDNRVDASDSELFGRGLSSTSKTQLTSTLGVVVRSQ